MYATLYSSVHWTSRVYLRNNIFFFCFVLSWIGQNFIHHKKKKNDLIFMFNYSGLAVRSLSWRRISRPYGRTIKRLTSLSWRVRYGKTVKNLMERGGWLVAIPLNPEPKLVFSLKRIKSDFFIFFYFESFLRPLILLVSSVKNSKCSYL